MIKSKAMKLVEALRSGKYSQGKDRLVDDNDNFCCLGVACNISKSNLEWTQDGLGNWKIGGEYEVLPPTIQAEYGFCNDNGVRKNLDDIIIEGELYSSLADANDAGCTFEQIADYIEEHWEML